MIVVIMRGENLRNVLRMKAAGIEQCLGHIAFRQGRIDQNLLSAAGNQCAGGQRPAVGDGIALAPVAVAGKMTDGQNVERVHKTELLFFALRDFFCLYSVL